MKVVFLDRDGTIIVEPRDERVDSLEKLELIPGAIRGMRILVTRGFALVMVTNQEGLGTTVFPFERFEESHSKLLRILEREGIRFSHIFICPHTPADHCECRKPKTGLVKEFLRENPLDRSRCFMVGDRETDVQFGKNIGCKTVRLTAGEASESDYVTGSLLEACTYIVLVDRLAGLERSTS